ncbi:unnamed protein product [Lota lota]
MSLFLWYMRPGDSVTHRYTDPEESKTKSSSSNNDDDDDDRNNRLFNLKRMEAGDLAASPPPHVDLPISLIQNRVNEVDGTPCRLDVGQQKLATGTWEPMEK